MKRIFLACLVSAILFILSLSGVAENFDITTMSDDELTSLSAVISEEMTKRGLQYQHLYIGEYIIGTDLPAGTYVLNSVDVYDSSIGPYIQYDICEYQDEKWRKISFQDLEAVNQKVTFHIYDGQKLVIHNGEFEVISYKTN